VVDVSFRIKMDDIIHHQFMTTLDPSSGFLFPPPITDIAKPVPDEILYGCDIDSDTLHSLRIIWRGQADDETLRQLLVSSDVNQAKAFYWLLERYRERRLERYGMDDEFDGGGFLERVVGIGSGEIVTEARPYQFVMPTPKIPFEERVIPSSAMLPQSPQELSSMDSTLAAFEVVGREEVADMEVVTPLKARRNTSKPRGPRQIAAPVSAKENKGLGIMNESEIAAAVDQVTDRFSNVLGNFNRQTSSVEVDRRKSLDVAMERKRVVEIAEKENVAGGGAGGRGEVLRHSRQRAGTVVVEENGSPRRASSRRVTSLGEKKARQRPPALELLAPKKFSKTLIAPAMRPAPPTPRLPAATMASPQTPVTGFFANLFNWRPQMFVLRSFEGIATTRRECEKLLTQYTVGVDKESEDIWKCCVQQAHDPNGVLVQKEVKFRVEFSTVYELDTPTPTAKQPYPHKMSGGYKSKNSLGDCGYASRALLIQEKGALSTFKIVYQLIRDDWKLDYTPGLTPRTPSFGPPSRVAVDEL